MEESGTCMAFEGHNFASATAGVVTYLVSMLMIMAIGIYILSSLNTFSIAFSGKCLASPKTLPSQLMSCFFPLNYQELFLFL